MSISSCLTKGGLLFVTLTLFASAILSSSLSDNLLLTSCTIPCSNLLLTSCTIPCSNLFLTSCTIPSSNLFLTSSSSGLRSSLLMFCFLFFLLFLFRWLFLFLLRPEESVGSILTTSDDSCSDELDDVLSGTFTTPPVASSADFFSTVFSPIVFVLFSMASLSSSLSTGTCVPNSSV
uniref:NADH dehydrogenase subunit 6 n=1 Tax=Cacopsylla melanoneura TaxID=428564 RepID=A0A8D8SNS9_9HEMI